MLVEKSFDTGEVVLNYAEGPDNGPPLILLHGVTSRWQALIPIINEFTNRWHIYALDFRGHGASGRTPDKYGLRYHYNDAVKFLTQIVREPVHIYGHSMGGRIALIIAANNPYITKSIITADISLRFSRDAERLRTSFKFLAETLEGTSSVREIMEVYRERMGVDTEVLLTRAKNFSVLDPDVPGSIADKLTDPDDPESFVYGYKPFELIAEVRCPVLLLQAEKGKMIDEDVEKALSILSDGYHVKLKGLSHVLHHEEVAPVVRAVNAFLESLR
jgi:pimeloyl-ACP methyl ester carboxylesterase